MPCLNNSVTNMTSKPTVACCQVVHLTFLGLQGPQTLLAMTFCASLSSKKACQTNISTLTTSLSRAGSVGLLLGQASAPWRAMRPDSLSHACRSACIRFGPSMPSDAVCWSPFHTVRSQHRSAANHARGHRLLRACCNACKGLAFNFFN